MVSSGDNEADDTSAAEGVQVSAPHEFFRSPLLQGVTTTPETRPGLRAWTDDYSNLYSILKKPGDNN